jgi:hypothetical protein
MTAERSSAVKMRGTIPEDYAVSLLDRILRDTPPGPRRDGILAIRSELLSGTSFSELKMKYASFDYPLSTEERVFLERVGLPAPPDPGREAGG